MTIPAAPSMPLPVTPLQTTHIIKPTTACQGQSVCDDVLFELHQDVCLSVLIFDSKDLASLKVALTYLELHPDGRILSRSIDTRPLASCPLASRMVELPREVRITVYSPYGGTDIPVNHSSRDKKHYP